MKFYKKCEACDKRKKYITYWKRKKKKKKKGLGVPAWFEPRMPALDSNVTTTVPANYVFKTESSFYIITYSS